MGIKRLPWLRNLKKTAPEAPLRLPIAAGAISNGEGWWPDTKRKQTIRKLVEEKAEEISRKHGVDRREFMASSCGMATTLFVINMVNGCSSPAKTPIGGAGGTGVAAGTGGGAGMGAAAGTAAQAGMGAVAGTGTTAGMGSAGTGVNAGMGSAGTGNAGTGSAGMGAAGDGGFVVPEEACWNPDLATSMFGGENELVIDMQSHFATPETNPVGAFLLDTFVGQINMQRFPWLQRSPGVTGSMKYDRAEYINQILMGSPTTVGVLSGIAYEIGPDGTAGTAVLSNEDLLGGADYLAGMYPGRILKHCMVMPNDRIDVQLAMMERVAGSYHNWKTYPPWQGNTGSGYWLTDDVALRMFQKGIDLGLPVFCIHKGFPLNGFSAEHSNARDVGPCARMFGTSAYLVIYHSAFEAGLAAGESSEPTTAWMGGECAEGTLVGGQWPEGPYDENDAAVQAMYPLDRGVNTLIKSLRDSNIGPNGKDLDNPEGPVTTNVYAECGGVWPALMTGRKEEAMHYWGKLLKHVGEDRLVWGTDCLWFGSPAPLIQAFKCFQISEEFQDRYGYPAMTQEIKEKILGQNARILQNLHPDVNIPNCHADVVGMAHMKLRRELDEEFGPRRDMLNDVWAPKTRREFLALVRREHKEKLAWSGNVPTTEATRKFPIG